MLISREREKLLEAIKYFTAKTKHCGFTKLFKLLFFLDFDHFRETGRSITGLKYQAWQFGPVPSDLYDELNGHPKNDLAAQLQVEGPKLTEQESVDFTVAHVDDVINTWGGEEYRVEKKTTRIPAKIHALKKFNEKLFSRRELALMERIAFIYKDANAEQISEVSHLKGKPWEVTKSRYGLKAQIDYMLALDEHREGAPSKEEILARIEERNEVLHALK